MASGDPDPQQGSEPEPAVEPPANPLPSTPDPALVSFLEEGDFGETPQLPDQADSRNLRPVASAPTRTPVTRVRDVAIAPTGTDDASVEELEAHPPANGVQLGRGLSIARLSDDDFQLIVASSSCA